MGLVCAKNASKKFSRLGTFNVVFTGHFVKFLQNLVYSTIHPPPLRHTLSVYTVHLVWEGGEGGEVREKIEG